MADINGYIAKALEAESAPRKGAKRRKKVRRLQLSLVLWIAAGVLVVYELEHWSAGLGMEAVSLPVAEVDRLYDRAQTVLKQRFEQGGPMLSPFDDPELQAAIGVKQLSDSRYLLYYLNNSYRLHGRELNFSRG